MGPSKNNAGCLKGDELDHSIRKIFLQGILPVLTYGAEKKQTQEN